MSTSSQSHCSPHGRPHAFVPGRDPEHSGNPRGDWTKLHGLTDTLVLLVLAVICGAGSFAAIAHCGQLNEAWLRTFLRLLHSISSHDTLGRVFARLNKVQFEADFRDWVQDTFALTPRARRCSSMARVSADPMTGVEAWGKANRLLVRTAVDD